MRGIILAGGTGSRLGPLSRVTNKHLLPTGPVPMIYHPLAQLLCNDITEICVVSGLYHLGSVVSLLGSGSRFGCSFTYKVQDEAGGIAEALDLCRDFSGDDDIFVLLGDNIFESVLGVKSFYPELPTEELPPDAMFFIKEVSDPERFGVAEVDHLKKLIDIEEKPENPKSNMAVVGAYVYSQKIWNAIASIERSERGELEVSDANRWLIRNGVVKTSEVTGWWSDAGTQESYKKANVAAWSYLSSELNLMLKKMMEK